MSQHVKTKVDVLLLMNASALLDGKEIFVSMVIGHLHIYIYIYILTKRDIVKDRLVSCCVVSC